ncbi:MAG: hypothetical protein ALAOOOJD_04675 [bacterium]|nr:hypothetical protein [bacterium]
MAMPQYAHSLDAIIAQSEQLKQVRKNELHAGDWIVVVTLNSIYSIRVGEEGWYTVSGGWFDREGVSPMRTTIAGCTWGGSILKADIVAACGLSLEFGNRVVTSTIQKIFIVPHGGEN